MTHTVAKAVAIGASALMAAGPAFAQDDWDFGQDPARHLAIAAVTFDNFGVAVRCLNDTLSVVVSGVPAQEGEQTIRYAMADRPEDDSSWVGSPDGRSIFSIWPGAVASDMQKGGRLSLAIPGPDRVRRLAVDLPPSPAAIGQVFAACGREAPQNDNDEPARENLNGLRWRSVPQPTFPSGTDSTFGVAALLCTTDNGGAPRDCKIESEFPEGGGFGRAAVVGAHRNGRVELAEGATGELGDRTIAFVVRYRLRAETEVRAPSRLPAVPRATSVPPTTQTTDGPR